MTGLGVVLAVILARMVWMWLFGWVGRGLPNVKHGFRSGNWRERLVLGWSGMRGAITLAALLAVPRTTSAGGPLAGRNDIIYLGFAVIIATLVGQGMTLPLLVRRLRLPENPSVADAERAARVELARAALDRIGAACENGELPDELTDGLRAQYLGRLRRLQTSPEGQTLDGNVVATARAELDIRRDLIALQRQKLLTLRDQGRIGVTTLRTIERDLDLEEARFTSA